MHLNIRADHARQTLQLRLCDSHGNQQAFHSVALAGFSERELCGMFDVGRFLAHYAVLDAAAALDAIAVCIAQKLLGEQIFMLLWSSSSARSLRITLPPPPLDGVGQDLIADLARVPWEIAKPQPGALSLAQKNLLMRVCHEAAAPPHASPLPLMRDEALRVLFVFAEAQGSLPLGMRRERREMMRLFRQEIYPKRRVIADCLTHGVTRARLQAQIAEAGGYHILHWSGHGGQDVLELATASGVAECISGAQLLALLNAAGGYLPQLVFLSACNSGAIGRAGEWPDPAPGVGISLPRQAGFTGTAHALLQAGVPAVVAMRYTVGDDYARELAQGFYRALLAHEKPKDVATALNFARLALHSSTQASAASPASPTSAATLFSALDAATPVLFGAAAAFCLTPEPSPALAPRDPRLPRLDALSLTQHPYFVGRTWQLAALGSHFFDSSAATSKAVALITGPLGIGKSALCAEVVDLWQGGFAWVVLFSAKSQALGFDAFMRDIHTRLDGERQVYHQHLQRYPADAIYRVAEGDFTGAFRLERMMRNLCRAMRAEKILLVLDHFESNLVRDSQDGAPQPVCSCQDPAWEQCLALLAGELGRGSDGVDNGSRLLITSRYALAALPDKLCHHVTLGPLQQAEADLYLCEHPLLAAMAYGENEDECEVAQRVLTASRCYPALMDRLAKLAAIPERRPQLLRALASLAQHSDFEQLPVLLAEDAADARQLAYWQELLQQLPIA